MGQKMHQDRGNLIKGISRILGHERKIKIFYDDHGFEKNKWRIT